MIRHLVLFKLNDGIDRHDDERAEAAAKAFEGLDAVVPGVREWQCGWNTTARDIAYDFGINSLFEDRAALQAYGDHPAHRAAAAQWQELATWVVVDFEV